MDLYGNKIFTRRLQLRKIEEGDLELLVRWSNTPAAYGLYLTPEHLELEQLRHQLRSEALWNEQEKMFLVELRDTGKPVGTIHYWQPPDKKGTAVISLKIALPSERGKGYGTELQKILIMYLFNQAKFQNVVMYTDVDNKVQQHCLRTLGFKLVQSLTYEDQQVQRIGHKYILNIKQYKSELLYLYHYE